MKILNKNRAITVTNIKCVHLTCPFFISSYHHPKIAITFNEFFIGLITMIIDAP